MRARGPRWLQALACGLGLLAAGALDTDVAAAPAGARPLDSGGAGRVIRTRPLRFTGERSGTRTIRTPTLRLTGIRPRGRTIAVPTLRMTGANEDPVPPSMRASSRSNR